MEKLFDEENFFNPNAAKGLKNVKLNLKGIP